MSDTSNTRPENRGQDQAEASRQAARDRQTSRGQAATAYGPGGNPLSQDDEGNWVDENGTVVANPVDESGNPVA